MGFVTGDVWGPHMVGYSAFITLMLYDMSIFIVNKKTFRPAHVIEFALNVNGIY